MGISRHIPPPEPLRIFRVSPQPGDVVRDVGVVIVAAGSSARVGDGELKQFRWIAGKPMLMHSVQLFLSRADVCGVVVVLPQRYVPDPPPWLLQGDLDRLLLSTGGATRAESVRNGLEDLVDDARIVLIHDAARPFVTNDMVDRVVAGARSGRATIPALPVFDTIKERGEDGRIVRTVPRETLWRAQTPQGFPREMIVRAHRNATAAKLMTDDASLLESIGEAVYIVDGDERAMKVTEAGDFVRAEAVMNAMATR